jgi:transcriptional regulator
MSMYHPPQFRSDDPAIAADLMRRHAFATLVSNDDQGFPFATHLPLHLEEREGRFVLLGHFAKPNPHWRHLQAAPQGLAMFMGPHAYQSPRIYPDLQRVPELELPHRALQGAGQPGRGRGGQGRPAEEADRRPRAAYAQQWRSLPEDYTARCWRASWAWNWKC